MITNALVCLIEPQPLFLTRLIHYLHYWSLRRRPFLQADEEAFFAGVPQREAIAGLNDFASHRLSSAMLVAPPRCGTTSLLSYAKRMRGFGNSASEVVLTRGNHSFRAAIQSDLCRSLGYPAARGDLASKIKQAIDVSTSQGVQIIWLIDPGKSAAAHVARRLVRASHGLSVVLATTSDQWQRRAEEFGRCSMRIDLAPLSVADTIEYVRFCLAHAGAPEPLFPDNAVVRLHEVTGGRIADLAVAAESALALAASGRLGEVSPAIVEATAERIARAA
jgi:hypothetical protein